MKFLSFLLIFGVLLVASCQKEETQIALPTNTDSTINERGGFANGCIRKTVHYTELAGFGTSSTAFTGNWMQELDRIANNCTLQSECQSVKSSGISSFCCTQELLLGDILNSGGYGQNWPYISPAEQDYIIAFALNYAKTKLQPCAPGVTPTISAVDFQRDAFITSALYINVKWQCCNNYVTKDPK
jgi:hypothetical protein